MSLRDIFYGLLDRGDNTDQLKGGAPRVILFSPLRILPVGDDTIAKLTLGVDRMNQEVATEPIGLACASNIMNV
jgi:hypothetical protein